MRKQARKQARKVQKGALREQSALWGRNDVRTHLTQALVWAHDTYRPGKWHLVTGERTQDANGAGSERATACAKRVVDSFGYEVEEHRSGQPISSTPGGHRWRGIGLPPVGSGRTEGVCVRCAKVYKQTDKRQEKKT